MKVPYHGIMNTEADPDEKQVYHLFRKCGMEENEALTALLEIRTMAGQNILAKMDSQAVAQDAKLEAIRTELRTETKTIRWLIVIVVLLATLVLTIGQQRSQQTERLPSSLEAPAANMQAPPPATDTVSESATR